MFHDCVPRKGAAVYHVHVLHVIGQLYDRGLNAFSRPRQSSQAVGFRKSLEFFIPFCAEPVQRLFIRSRKDHHSIRRGSVPEEVLLKLCRILIQLCLICHRFCLSQASTIWVHRVQIFHNEHIIDRYLHHHPSGGPDGVIGETLIGGLLYPLDWYRPQFRRHAVRIPFDYKICLSLQKKIFLEQLPECGRRKLHKRIWILHEVQKGMLCNFRSGSIHIYAEEFSFRIRQISRDFINRSKPWVFPEGFHPFRRVSCRRRGILRDHCGLAVRETVCPVGSSSSE